MKMIVIADDFTGANDTGVQLAKKGARTDVLLSPQQKTAAWRRRPGDQHRKPCAAGCRRAPAGKCCIAALLLRWQAAVDLQKRLIRPFVAT
ncbi:Uncharacterized protein conserved in bacteria [Serratia odorifera]|uniref:Uncharacterized protein conserved in bacteria n=1 Tax=Serratia odorifera TaxID=618 RepID=A0A447KRY1_SEROD|nr:Uncharacterized protein conserved in bacteria [Serratia odorifera]